MCERAMVGLPLGVWAAFPHNQTADSTCWGHVVKPVAVIAMDGYIGSS